MDMKYCSSRNFQIIGRTENPNEESVGKFIQFDQQKVIVDMHCA